MLFYYYIYLAIALIVLYLFVRFRILKRKNISLEFFTTAQRSENNGCYEDAVLSYEKALTEANKSKHQAILKNKIIEKLEVLHTVIEYNNSFHHMRQN